MVLALAAATTAWTFRTTPAGWFASKGCPIGRTSKSASSGPTCERRLPSEERIRTRVVQGAGRATRQSFGPCHRARPRRRLTRYLASPVVRQALDPDLQAEVDFRPNKQSRGRERRTTEKTRRSSWSRVTPGASTPQPYLTEARRAVERRDTARQALLSCFGTHEVEARMAAFRGDFVGARDAGQRAARALSGEDAVRYYRSLWLYLARDLVIRCHGRRCQGQQDCCWSSGRGSEGVDRYDLAPGDRRRSGVHGRRGC